jgi:hypothetical protein
MSYRHFVYKSLFGIALLSSFAAPDALAAGNGKVDSMLQHAIEETAKQPMEEMEETVVETMPAEPPQFESVIDEDVAVLRDDFEDLKKPEKIEPYEPGFRMGRMLIEPKLLVSETYNDNILTTTNNKKDDFITRVKPSLKITIGEEDSNNPTEIGAQYEYVSFADHDEEDEQNYSAYARGELGEGNKASIPFELSYARDHEDRQDDLTLQLANEPLRTDAFEAAAGLKVNRGSWSFKTMGRYIKDTFDNGRDENGNRVVRDDADRDITKAEAEIAYNFAPAHSFIIGGSFQERDYERLNFQSGSYSGAERSSEGYQTFARWEWKGESFKTDIKVGWDEYDYEDDVNLSDVETVIAEARIRWNITDATALNMAYIRDIHEDDEVVQAIIRERAEVGMDFQLGQTFQIGLIGAREDLDFEGISRDDETYEGGLSFDFFINDVFAVGAEYIYTKRKSDLANLDFERSTGLMRLATRL